MAQPIEDEKIDFEKKEESEKEEETEEKIEKKKPIKRNLLIEEAKKQADRLEEQNKIFKENIKKLEELNAELAIGGTSHGGGGTKTETEEEKWRREAKIRYAGTGLDPT